MREIIDILTGHYRDPATVPAVRGASGRDATSTQAAVKRGLREVRKQLPSRLLYDRRGSDLMHALSCTPESYQSRTELVLLRGAGRAFADIVGEGASLIELGGCDATKARLLLAEMRHPLLYMPIGEAAQPLWSAAMQLQLDYPYLAVRPVIGDYAAMSELPGDGPWVLDQVAFALFGGAICGFDPITAAHLLHRVGRMARRTLVLVTYDLRTDVATMEGAYNDAAGAAADFNTNVLVRLNRELHADFDPRSFRHVVLWNEACGRIELHLESRKRQVVKVGGDAVTFDRGENMQTLSAYRYTTLQFQRMAARSGLQTLRTWVDHDRRGAVALLSGGAEATH